MTAIAVAVLLVVACVGFAGNVLLTQTNRPMPKLTSAALR